LEDLNKDKIHSIKMDVKEIKWDGVVWNKLIWLMRGTSGGLMDPCEQYNTLLGSMNCREFFAYLKNH